MPGIAKKTLAICVLFTLAAGGAAIAQHRHSDSVEHQLEHLIMASYLHGAFNELNPDAMRQGFHPDFAIFSAKGDDLGRYEIDDWIAGVTKRKASPDFDPDKNRWEYEFEIMDVTGGAAFAKVTLSKDGKLVYTDYLSLLKFDSGWKIAAKVYNKHD